MQQRSQSFPLRWFRRRSPFYGRYSQRNPRRPLTKERSLQETIGSEICRSKRLLRRRNKRRASRTHRPLGCMVVYFSRVLPIARSSNDSPRISESAQMTKKAGGGNGAGGSRATWTKPRRGELAAASESIEPVCEGRAPVTTTTARGKKAGAGIEPANSGFADRDLTTWLPRRGFARRKISGFQAAVSMRSHVPME